MERQYDSLLEALIDERVSESNKQLTRDCLDLIQNLQYEDLEPELQLMLIREDEMRYDFAYNFIAIIEKHMTIILNSSGIKFDNDNSDLELKHKYAVMFTLTHVSDSEIPVLFLFSDDEIDNTTKIERLVLEFTNINIENYIESVSDNLIGMLISSLERNENDVLDNVEADKSILEKLQQIYKNVFNEEPLSYVWKRQYFNLLWLEFSDLSYLLNGILNFKSLEKMSKGIILVLMLSKDTRHNIFNSYADLIEGIVPDAIKLELAGSIERYAKLTYEEIERSNIKQLEIELLQNEEIINDEE